MNYQEAFFKVVNEYGIEVLKDRFFTRSLISDYIGGSIDDNQLLNAYCLLDKNQSVFEIIQANSVNDSKAHFKHLISSQNKGYTIRQYIKSIEPIYLLIFPSEYTPLKETNHNIKTQASLQKHQRVNPINNVAVGVAKAIKGQNNTFRAIRLNVPYCDLEIAFTKKKKLSITKNGKNVTNKIKPVYKQDAVYLDIKDPRANYKLEVPMKLYDSIDIAQEGGYLSTSPEELSKYIAKRFNIYMKDGTIYLKSSAKSINVIQDRGYILQSGRYYDFSLTGKKVEVYSFCYEDAPKELNMDIGSGSIDLYFNNARPKPRINHLFKKVKNVDGVYKLGSGTIKMNLSVKNGKIKVH